MYTTSDAKQFAEIAFNLHQAGNNDLAYATSQAFYDITRDQPNAAELHATFQATIATLSN